MKTFRLLTCLAAALLPAGVAPEVRAQGRPYQEGRFQGRIAYSADGNHNDQDDWAASSVALAILAESGQRERLVHFDYNCILPLTHSEWESEHAESVLGAADRYGFARSRFFDCRKDLQGALDSIARAINDSSADNPLYFILAGPMEVPFLGIQRANPERRKFVYCISHSSWNDGFDPKYEYRFNKRSVIEQDIRWVQLRDQNPLLSLSPYGRPAQPEEFGGYSWMRDSPDPKVQFLWQRMVASTRPDPSDAGMAYFLISGDEECDPAKLKRLLLDRDRKPPVSARKQVRLEAENFRHLEGFVLENRNDRDASHRLGIKLSGGTSGSIRTLFDEPFVGEDGPCEVVVRYLDASGQRCRFAFFLNGTTCGPRWESAGEGRGWTSRSIDALTVRRGDEIRLDAEGPDARLDYLQINWPGPSRKD